MLKELKKEVQKINYLKYPATFHELLEYFLKHNYVDFAFVVKNESLKLLTFKDVIPMLVNCHNGNICNMEISEYFFKNPIIIDVDDNENQAIYEIQKALDLEYPIVITKQRQILGQVPFKKLIFFLKNHEVEQALFCNPLTGLPGNYQIQKAYYLKQEPFCIAYFDLNNFKPFNDKYGIAKGDEVIKFCGEFLSKTFQNHFVGHVGGDDFIIIGDLTKEELLKAIENLNKELILFHSETDIQRGYITALDRYGRITNFPLLSGSLGALKINKKQSYEEITQLLTELKHSAKSKAVQSEIPFEYVELN